MAFNEKSGSQAVYGYSVTEEFGDKQVGVSVNSWHKRKLGKTTFGGL